MPGGVGGQRREPLPTRLNQEENHKSKNFKEEYLEILKKNDVKYDEKYLFDFFE
jgi:hypothetical protein